MDEKDWKEIIYKDGKLNEEQVLKELSDYAYLIQEVPIVYEQITYGRLSYPNYPAKTVISIHDDLYWDKDIVKEDVKEILSEQSDIEDLKRELEEYFEIDSKT